MVYGLFFFLTGFCQLYIFSSDKLIDTSGNCPPQQFPRMNHKMPMIRSLSVYRYELPLSFVKEPEALIRVERHPGKPEWLRLYLPYELVPAWLSTVKNIPGRRWDPVGKVWEIPYTRSTLRFLERHLREVASLAFTPDEDISEQQEAIADRRVATLYRSQSSELRLRAPAADQSIRERISRIYGQRWDEAACCWWVPNRESTLAFIRKIFGEELDVIEESRNKTSRNRKPDKQLPQGRLNEAQREAATALEERLMLKRYGYSTLKTYRSQFRSFLLHFPETAPADITERQIREYLLFLVGERGVSESTQGQAINAIKFYYEKVLGQERKTYYIDRPKKPKKLPDVLGEADVLRILRVCENTKHRCILMLVYSGGLRLGEVVNLKVQDIDYERKQIFIHAGKGKKDRYTLLSEVAMQHLSQYMREYAPDDWLFEGQYGGRYSKRSVQQIFRRALERSGVQKRATLHTLRHSFATHLLEKGVNLRYIQELLGHESSRTTEIYTHVTRKGIEQIQSPLDYLDWEEKG